MRTVSAGALAALDTGRFGVRTLLWVELPSSSVGFWDEAYDATIEGRAYLAAYDGFRVSPLSSNADMGVRSVDVVLNGLDARVVSEIEAESYHQRPISITMAVISSDSGAILALIPWFSGFIDQPTRVEQPSGEIRLTFRCESISREQRRSGARTRSDADQRQIDASDGFFKHVTSAINVTLQWGKSRPPQRPPVAQKPQGVISGLIDKLF